jgi:hypothetical protein
VLDGGGSEESLNCKRPNGTNGAIGTIRAFGLYTTKETATLPEPDPSLEGTNLSVQSNQLALAAISSTDEEVSTSYRLESRMARCRVSALGRLAHSECGHDSSTVG